jgi:hypothetical protein
MIRGDPLGLKYEWDFQNVEIIMVQAAKLIGAGSALIA